jgi:hypothetical protein
MTAVLEPHARPATGAPGRSAIDRVIVPPLFTRHTLGAIEADRDRRRVFRETHPRRRRRANAMAHPRIAAAIAARARLLSQARVDQSRWADEGGRFDPDAAARLRNSHKEMKRCGL